ncbi:hypothetical protein NY997_26295, partial [Escherichia coli]|uniref:hypothetical protein n=1 Tax=Escherichia coli TaxID=562 RepID=UPI0022F10515
MTAPHLAIAGMPAEFGEMRGGSVYWVVAAGSAPADLLGASALIGAGDLDDVVLATLGRGVEPMLSLLTPEQ